MSDLRMPDGRPAPSVMTRDEAIEFLRIEGKEPAQTIARYRTEGRLKGYRIGNHVRFTGPDLMQFVKENET